MSRLDYFPNLTHRQISEHLGISRSHVRRMLYGTRHASLKLCRKISTVCGISIAQVIADWSSLPDSYNS